MADLPTNLPANPPALADLRARLRAATQARVLLGRAGQGLPTGALLDFQLDHARARDAVHRALEPAGFAEAVAHPVIDVRSRAATRAEYLKRPDLGRRLDTQAAARLLPTGDELVIIVADGLSAPAIHAHAASLVVALIARLPGWRIAPIVLATQARVALGDEIGELMRATCALMLIGERPGLSAPDSLGAYLTWAPCIGRMDSERNCVSNIRPPHGLSYEVAADAIVSLITAARLRKLTGVNLSKVSAIKPLLE